MTDWSCRSWTDLYFLGNSFAPRKWMKSIFVLVSDHVNGFCSLRGYIHLNFLLYTQINNKGTEYIFTVLRVHTGTGCGEWNAKPCNFDVDHYRKVYRSAVSVEELSSRTKHNLCKFCRVDPFGASHNVVHINVSCHGISTLFRALPWPYSYFYMNRIHKYNWLRKISIEREE